MAKKGKKKAQKTDNKANDSGEHFEVGDLVAAKVKGFPFWPGRITKVQGTGSLLKYNVKFFQSNDHSVLPPTAIVPFAKWQPKPHELKRKNLSQAFKLCSDEYDSQLAARDAKHDRSPAPSLETTPSEAQSTHSGAHSADSEISTLPKISASPEPPLPEAPPAPSEDGSSSLAAPVISCQADSTENDANEDEICCDKPEQPVKVKSERVSPQKAKRKVAQRSPAKLDTRTDNTYTHLPKVEKDDPNSIDLTIKKLQSKIDAKLREKARMKQEETEKRILKSTDKLVRINKKLAKFSIVSNRMIIERQSNFIEWESAAKNFESINEALNKCIGFLCSKRRSIDLRTCRDILTDLAKNFKHFKESRKDGKSPQSTHDKIKLCLKLMKKKGPIYTLINMHDHEFEKQENAMIERKENSVEQ